MTKRKASAAEAAGEQGRAPEPEMVDVVLLDDETGFGARGTVVSVPMDAAAELETGSRARRANARDRALAGL